MASPRILVIRPDRVGDVVLSTPVLQALRRQWPDAYLGMMVRPYTRDILVANPYLDEILTDDPDGEDRGATGFLRQVRLLRSKRFDTALMLLPTMRIAWMLFCAGIPRRIGVGHKIYQTLTFTRSVSRNQYIPLRHEADYCLDLARAIGAHAEHCSPGVFLTDEERADARTLLDAEGIEHHPIIGIHPGNGHNAPNWNPARYGDLAYRLYDRYGATIVVTGSEDEQALIARMAVNAAPQMISLAGRLSLRRLMAVIGELDLLISSSTGPMHLAAVLDVPTVSLFCPLPSRSPTRWGSISDHAHILLPPGGECDTCDRGPMCDLSDITIKMVLEAVAQRLEKIDQRTQ